jgi:hypothetical protein
MRLARIWEYLYNRDHMKEDYHISAAVLFDFARRNGVPDPEQRKHLDKCAECREVMMTYRRWNSYIQEAEPDESKAS